MSDTRTSPGTPGSAPPGARRADAAGPNADADLPPPDRRRAVAGLTGLAALVLVVALWAPLRLRTTGMIEEWTYFAAFDRGQPIVATDVLVGQLNRPFVLLLYGLGYRLTPDSFRGLNVVHAAVFVGKGIALAAVLGRLLPEAPLVAFFSALLLLVQPGDTGLFSPRMLAHHAVVFFYLIAVYLLIRFHEAGGLARLLGMAVALALCLGTYEVAQPLVLATPLLLRWVPGRGRRIDGRLLAAWYLVPAAHLGLTVFALTRPFSYQAAVFATDTAAWTDRLAAYPYHLGRAYARLFVLGWRDAAGELLLDSWLSRVGGPIAALVAGIAGLVAWRLPRPAGALAPRRMLAAGVGGLVVVGLGFLAYLPSPHHRSVNERVFLLSSIGACLATVAIVWLACRALRLGRGAFVAGMALLLALATVGAFGQEQDVRLRSVIAQRALAGLARAVPGVEPGTELVIFDEARDFVGIFDAFALSATSAHFGDAVRYLYRAPALPVRLCYPDREAWGYARERCEVAPDGLVLAFGEAKVRRPWAGVLGVRYRAGTFTVAERIPTADGREILPPGYEPERRIRRAAAPARAFTLFERWPFTVGPGYLGPQGAFRLELDRFFPGYGWQPPEPTGSWMGNTRSSIELWLRADRTYRFRGHVAAQVVPGLLETLKVFVNETPITLASRPDSHGVLISGVIPRRVVARDARRTQLVFQVDRVAAPKALGMSDDTRRLGLLLDWIRISPL